MIEIELKFKADKFPETNLKKIKTKTQTDIYYDTNNYDLLMGGNFLRNRNNKSIDFKLNLNDLEHVYCKETNFEYDPFNKTKEIKDIFKSINLTFNDKFTTFEEFLKANNLSQLAIIDKQREEYKLEDITLCFDYVKNLGKFIEAEVMVKDDVFVDKQQIIEYIIKKLKKYKIIDNNYLRVHIGYVELYLREHNKKAYELGLYKD